jgi:hypothetical protein
VNGTLQAASTQGDQKEGQQQHAATNQTTTDQPYPESESNQSTPVGQSANSIKSSLHLSLASSPRIPLPALNACPPCTPTECFCDDGKKLTLEDMVEAFKVPNSTHLSNSCHYD